MDQKTTKKEIRKAILGKRDVLSFTEIEQLSDIICKRLCDIPEFEAAVDVCIYMPIKSEIRIDGTRKQWENLGKSLWVPRVLGSSMDFFAFDDKTVFKSGAYGIKEPVGDRILIPNEKTLVVLPGAVFSVNRDRIGYGGGYYDRYLEKHPQCSTAALCYDFQILDQIATEDFDIKPDVVISEKRIYRK